MRKLLLVLFSIFLLPLTVNAVDYDIKHLYVDAQVLGNGDMDVSELFVLDGSFNGYERDILYTSSYESLYDASGIENVEIYAKYVDDDVDFNMLNATDFDRFILSSSATNGSKAKYIESSISGGKSYRMYYYTDNESTAFLIKYTLKDVAILHNDVAEVYWNFIGSDFADNLKDVNIRVKLPKIDNSDNFRIWAHGDMTGYIDFINDSTVSGAIATVKKLDAYSPVDIRITFDKSLLNADEIKKIKTDDALASIIEVETALAEEQNALRKEIRAKYYFGLSLTFGFCVVLIIVWIFVFVKYDKERKAKFQMQYNREFIDDYNVEIIDYLMNKNITPNAMSASIMNLVYKKKISYEEIIGTSKKEYRFKVITREGLTETELKLVDFLFLNVGNNDEFTTVELKKYASSTKTCNKFMASYTSWKNKVISDAKNQNFFEKKGSQIIFGIVAIVLAFILNKILLAMKVEAFFVIIPLILSIIFLIYVIAFTKKTEKGIEHYAKWKAFKNFLEDFGTFDIKELPEIVLWERYLVYATVFGLADKIEKVMNVKIKEIENLEGNLSNSYVFYNHVNIAPTITSSVNRAISGAQAAVSRANATSRSSSGGGFGGGFSSGGGFGGGGGGGRGF